MLKRLIKKIMPATYEKIEKSVDKLERKLDEQNTRYSEQYNELKELISISSSDIVELSCKMTGCISDCEDVIKSEFFDMRERIEILTNEIQNIKQEMQESEKKLEVHLRERERKIETVAESHTIRLSDDLDCLKNAQETIRRTVNEVLWAHVFKDSIVNSNWLVDKTFSPGRWAMGYPELYVLYRVLDEFTPQSILEIGLGQSTKMIAQYVEEKKNSKTLCC